MGTPGEFNLGLLGDSGASRQVTLEGFQIWPGVRGEEERGEELSSASCQCFCGTGALCLGQQAKPCCCVTEALAVWVSKGPESFENHLFQVVRRSGGAQIGCLGQSSITPLLIGLSKDT